MEKVLRRVQGWEWNLTNRASIHLAAGLLVCGAALAAAMPTGVTGDWKTPGGSIVRVSACDAALCMAIVKLGPTAKGTTDQLNPDAALKGRSLCGMQIGEGFKPYGDAAARGGRIYDPESGKTYNAKLVWRGDSLELRGFVGVPLFGRTEVWTKVGAVKSCQ